MKKSLIILGLLSILTTTTFASSFSSFIYSKDIENKERTLLDDNENLINFQNIKYYKLKVGIQYFPVEEEKKSFGFYSDLGFGMSDYTSYLYNNQNKEIKYRSYLFNIGTTYAINNNFVFFGGIGIEHINGYSQEEDIHFIQIENKFNVNGGIAMYFFEGALGVVAEYDTSREAIGIGLTLRYQSGAANRYY